MRFDVLEAIDADPAAAFAAVGLRHIRAEQAADSWRELRITRRLHLMLAPHGLAYLATRIHEHYGNGAHEILTGNPYELTSVFGVGFAIADRIARAAGGLEDPSQRERAAVIHALAEAERSGSTCLPEDELAGAVRGLIGHESGGGNDRGSDRFRATCPRGPLPVPSGDGGARSRARGASRCTDQR